MPSRRRQKAAVWAAQAALKGGDRSYEKFLITLVKDEPRLLTDMGELEAMADGLPELNGFTKVLNHDDLVERFRAASGASPAAAAAITSGGATVQSTLEADTDPSGGEELNF